MLLEASAPSNEDLEEGKGILSAALQPRFHILGVIRSQSLLLQGLQTKFVFVLWYCFHFKGFISESRESFLEPSGVSMVTGLSGPGGKPAFTPLSD